MEYINGLEKAKRLIEEQLNSQYYNDIDNQTLIKIIKILNFEIEKELEQFEENFINE